MKAIFIISSLFVLQTVLSAPAGPDTPIACEAVFKKEICDGFDAIDDSVVADMKKGKRVRRLRPPSSGPATRPVHPIQELLEKVLLAKFKYLIKVGLLKDIPYLGKIVHNVVASNPEGIAKVISGGIFKLLQLGLKLLGAAMGGTGR